MADGPSPLKTAAGWRWTSDGGRLVIEAEGELRDLTGDWSLTAMGAMLEGFSRARLINALETGTGDVDCALTLSNGRTVRLVGAFDAAGEAAGQIITDYAEAAEGATPGPDLQPVFQPIISLKDGRIAGFEALARWEGIEGAAGAGARLEDGALAPNMLIQAADALSDWRAATGRDDLFVQVNLTGRDLAREDMPSLIEALMLGHRLPQGAIRIELTEQAALRDAPRAVEAANRLKALGAGLVLDDFGTGHSSFAWLADMPADGLKIDHDLARRMDEGRASTILEAIALLARRLGMTITAEGVESRQDAAKLRALGFDYAQGFGFARPMPREAALDFLKVQARPEKA